MSTEGTTTTQEKKTQKKSVSYAVKALSNHLETLKGEVITEEEHQKISKILSKPISEWIKKEYGV